MLPLVLFAIAASRSRSPSTSPSTITHVRPPESCGVVCVNVPLPLPVIVQISCESMPPATMSVMPSPFMSAAARPYSPETPGVEVRRRSEHARAVVDQERDLVAATVRVDDVQSASPSTSSTAMPCGSEPAPRSTN
jgi:hypothetical protein